MFLSKYRNVCDAKSISYLLLLLYFQLVNLTIELIQIKNYWHMVNIIWSYFLIKLQILIIILIYLIFSNLQICILPNATCLSQYQIFWTTSCKISKFMQSKYIMYVSKLLEKCVSVQLVHCLDLLCLMPPGRNGGWPTP